jgi:hypothetical protein
MDSPSRPGRNRNKLNVAAIENDVSSDEISPQLDRQKSSAFASKLNIRAGLRFYNEAKFYLLDNIQ